jgi:hypothetical protein
VTTTTSPTTPTTIEAAAPSTTVPETTTTTTLSPGVTPDTEVAGSRFAVAGLGILALGSGLGALEITKHPRRRKTGGPFDDLDESGDD